MDRGIALFRSGAYADAAVLLLALRRGATRTTPRPTSTSRASTGAWAAPTSPRRELERGDRPRPRGRRRARRARLPPPRHRPPRRGGGALPGGAAPGPGGRRRWVGLVRALRASGRGDAAERVLEQAPAEVRELFARPGQPPSPARRPHGPPRPPLPKAPRRRSARTTPPRSTRLHHRRALPAARPLPRRPGRAGHPGARGVRARPAPPPLGRAGLPPGGAFPRCATSSGRSSPRRARSSGIYRDYAAVRVELSPPAEAPRSPRGRAPAPAPQTAPGSPRRARGAGPAPEPRPGGARAASCRSCRAALPDDADAPLLPRTAAATSSEAPCSGCGRLLQPEWNFCIRCGTPREGHGGRA